MNSTGKTNIVSRKDDGCDSPNKTIDDDQFKQETERGDF